MRLAHERVAEHADPDLCHRAILRSRDRTDRRLVSGTRQVGHRLDRAHQPSGDSGRESVAEGRPRRRREPRPGARGRVCARVGDPARARLVRGAPRRPGDRGGVHLAAEQPARRVDDPRGGGREARARREAVHARSGRRGEGVRRRRARGPRAQRGVHVPPQPADEACEVAGRRGRDRRVAPRPRVLQLRHVRRAEHPAQAGRGRRVADGRRLLLRQRLAARGRGAGDGVRPGVVRPLRDRLGVRRDVAVPG